MYVALVAVHQLMLYVQTLTGVPLAMMTRCIAAQIQHKIC